MPSIPSPTRRELRAAEERQRAAEGRTARNAVPDAPSNAVPATVPVAGPVTAPIAAMSAAVATAPTAAPTTTSYRAARPAASRRAVTPARTRNSSARKRLAGAVAMSFVSLLAVSVSLPALAVTSEVAGSLPMSTVAVEAPQKFTASAPTQANTIVRDGFTSVEKPKPAPAPVAESVGTGDRTSIVLTGDQGWVLPVAGHISSGYGSRPNAPVAGVGAHHNGADIASECGGPIRAAAAGVVIESGYQGSYGNWVLIDHGDGIQTGYAHNSENLVEVGQPISAGEEIALVGSTGSSTGCHVHFEARIDDSPVDPVYFMSERGIALG